MEWIIVDNGNSSDMRGSENGVILRDEEHPLGARMTLGRDGDIAPFSITCGIYGWMFPTRFFSTQQEAELELERMKFALAEVLNIIPLKTDSEADKKTGLVSKATSKFVQQYP